MRTISSLFFFLVGLSALGQNGWEPCSIETFNNSIEKIEAGIVDGKSYSFSSRYDFYESLTGTIPKMTIDAQLICKDGKQLYLNQFGRIMVQNDVLNVVCDTSMKTIVLNDPNDLYLTHKTSADFETLLKSDLQVKRKIEGSKTKYYLEFPKGSSFLAAELWIKNGGMVEKYILYTANEILDDSEAEDKMIRPRMEVSYFDYRFGTEVQVNKLTTVADFVLVTSKDIQLNPTYSNYQLIDLRIANN